MLLSKEQNDEEVLRFAQDKLARNDDSRNKAGQIKVRTEMNRNFKIAGQIKSTYKLKGHSVFLDIHPYFCKPENEYKEIFSTTDKLGALAL